jgi:hypothetical protein
MRNAKKIQSDLTTLINTPNQGAKLSRIEDWFCTRPENEIAYGISSSNEIWEEPPNAR